MERFKVVEKLVGLPPFEAYINNDLWTLQHNVGGYIETVTIASDWTIICNEEGRLRGLPYNCRVAGVDFVGDIIFAGIKGDKFCDFPGTAEEVKEWLIAKEE